MAVVSQTVAQLLAASRHAHQRYRDNLTRMVGPLPLTKVLGDDALAGAALFEACRLRAEARAIDPQRTDSAWANEPETHDDDTLLNFYVEQLSR